MLARVVVDPEIFMNENVILRTYAVPLLGRGRVLFKNLKVLQLCGGGLLFKVRHGSDNRAELEGVRRTSDFPGRSYIPPPDAKNSRICGNLRMVGVKHKQFCSRFYSAFSIINLLEIMFVKFTNN